MKYPRYCQQLNRFTLIEVVLAIIVCAAIVFVVGALVPSGIQAVRQASGRYYAGDAANLLFATIKAEYKKGGIPITTYASTDGYSTVDTSTEESTFSSWTGSNLIQEDNRLILRKSNSSPHKYRIRYADETGNKILFDAMMRLKLRNATPDPFQLELEISWPATNEFNKRKKLYFVTRIARIE